MFKKVYSGSKVKPQLIEEAGITYEVFVVNNHCKGSILYNKKEKKKEEDQNQNKNKSIVIIKSALIMQCCLYSCCIDHSDV